MKIISVAVLIYLAFLAAYNAGCAPQAKDFGEPITETTLTPVAKILAHPQQFDKKIVRIEGRVLEECPAGGWVHLKDESGVIYVNLHPSNFSIPQVTGKKITVQGQIRKEGTQIEVIGKGVQLK